MTKQFMVIKRDFNNRKVKLEVFSFTLSAAPFSFVRNKLSQTIECEPAAHLRTSSLKTKPPVLSFGQSGEAKVKVASWRFIKSSNHFKSVKYFNLESSKQGCCYAICICSRRNMLQYSFSGQNQFRLISGELTLQPLCRF